MEAEKKKNEWQILLIVLPLTLLICLTLWYIPSFYRVQFARLNRVESQNGIYDLTDIDFKTGFVRLQGSMTYIPGILTPKEYADREKEAVIGAPQDVSAATSRMIVKVPEDAAYMVVRSSVDYAHRAYFNGRLRHQAGVPAEDAKDFTPGYAQMAEEVVPENGVIEIVQQGANFVHRQGGGHGGVYIGHPEVMRRFLALTMGMEIIQTGLFIALFLVHMMLFAVLRSYRANLTFSLLCFSWAVRAGITGSKVFYAFFPALPWQAAFRMEYLTLPIAAVLLIRLARQVFPGVLQKWYMRIVNVVSGCFSILCLTADTVLLSWGLLFYEGFFTIAILFLCARFAMKVPDMVRRGQFKIEQAISLSAYVFFLYAAVHDALYHLDVPLPLGFALTGVAMLVFSFFQMTAMFYGTMRETALAHERERRAQTEKEMLSEMNRLKSSFYTDLSHEMKTPLTVIAVNAQFAAQNIGVGVVDEETVTDLNAISAEARRLAQMVTSLVGIGRMQGAGDGLALLALDSLIKETARIYQTLFARRGNTLIWTTEPGLPPVEGSADQIVQVLINFLSNANRHTSGGEVSVRGEVIEQKVHVSVADNGTGIARELLPHVFERYCRGKEGGAGLGLPICKTIIEEHGGEIGIESEEGNGTKVWFALPAKEEIR